MKVQVVDGLAAVIVGVGDNAVSIFRKPEVLGDFARGDHEMPHQRSVFRLNFGHRANRFFGNKEHVHGSLRLDVVKRQAVLVFVNDFGRDFFGDDLAENSRLRIAHEKNLTSEVTSCRDWRPMPCGAGSFAETGGEDLVWSAWLLSSTRVIRGERPGVRLEL